MVKVVPDKRNYNLLNQGQTRYIRLDQKAKNLLEEQNLKPAATDLPTILHRNMRHLATSCCRVLYSTNNCQLPPPKSFCMSDVINV